jgi:uncharacterized protein involved in exopolysaccharide biosynthesis
MNDEIEIDLRKYILLLFKHWWQILVCAAIIAILIFSFSSMLTVSYQATALVAITKPRYELNFNTQIQTLDIQPANNAFLDLATSDDVLKQVYDQWTNRPASVKDLQDFQDTIIQVKSGSDTSILKLIVTTDNPEESARLANLWAASLITKANTVYFGQDQQLTFLENQMENAKNDLDQAENALVDFQAQNQLQILTNQLNSVLQNQRDYLAIQRNIYYLDHSLQGLRSQLISNPGDQATIADQLSALLFQIQTYNSQPIGSVESQPIGSAQTLPLQIQFTDPAAFGSLDNQVQITILDNLAKSIQDRSTQVAKDLKTFDPQILSLQQSVQQYQSDQDQLENTHDIAQKTYTTLAQTVDQTRISSRDPSNELQLASSALPPSQPLSRNRLRNTLLGGFTGGILAVIAVLVLDWWRGQLVPKEK